MKVIGKSLGQYLTSFRRKWEISRKREAATLQDREVGTLPESRKRSGLERPAADSFACPYCLSQNFIRRGFRQKTHEKVQLYLCRDCGKTFTPHLSKGKHYPLAAVLDGLSYYHLGHSLEKTGQMLAQYHQLTVNPTTLSNWLSEFRDYCPFSRMRSFALKKYSPQAMVLTSTLAHQQLFRYRFHRAKCQLMIEDDYKHRRFEPLREFLEMVPTECPHQYFQKGLRASEAPMTFSKTQMIVRAKQNYANKLCRFVLQSVKERKKRHDSLQRFMLYNDSVTVATEVPVYLTKDDLEHMQTQLGFEMYLKKPKTGKQNLTLFDPKKLPKLITGHIDALQIRNGQIHLLDYKPQAAKVRPVEQLTLYAMALSRLTGLRMFEFKCAWFDEKDYFEFYPLHVVYKPKRKRQRKKIQTDEGIYLINQLKEKIEKIRPTWSN